MVAYVNTHTAALHNNFKTATGRQSRHRPEPPEIWLSGNFTTRRKEKRTLRLRGAVEVRGVETCVHAQKGRAAEYSAGLPQYAKRVGSKCAASFLIWEGNKTSKLH